MIKKTVRFNNWVRMRDIHGNDTFGRLSVHSRCTYTQHAANRWFYTFAFAIAMLLICGKSYPADILRHFILETIELFKIFPSLFLLLAAIARCIHEMLQKNHSHSREGGGDVICDIPSHNVPVLGECGRLYCSPYLREYAQKTPSMNKIWRRCPCGEAWYDRSDTLNFLYLSNSKPLCGACSVV